MTHFKLPARAARDHCCGRCRRWCSWLPAPTPATREVEAANLSVHKKTQPALFQNTHNDEDTQRNHCPHTPDTIKQEHRNKLRSINTNPSFKPLTEPPSSPEDDLALSAPPKLGSHDGFYLSLAAMGLVPAAVVLATTIVLLASSCYKVLWETPQVSSRESGPLSSSSGSDQIHSSAT